ncbi:MAG: porin family protein, partial [bacterium]|nr:porin family protein [bacterium]
MKTIAVLTCLLLALAVSSSAISLEKRHQLELRLGMWNQTTDVRTETGVGGVETSVESDGFVGGIAYGHWLQENLALTFGINGMAIDISTNSGATGVTSKTSSVASMLMGLKFYFPASTLEGSVRPYIKAAGGPFIGTQSSTEVGLTVVNEDRTETAFGGQLAAGLDFVTGRNFMMSAGFGWNLMSDFNEPIGGSKNYSGP